MSCEGPEITEGLLADYARLHDSAGDPALEAVRAAIFVEDVFDLTLSDAEIDPGVLGSAAALRVLLERHTGAG